MCVVPFNATFIAPLVTAVTYVYVCNKMGKVGESVYINKTIEIDIYYHIHIHIHIYQTLNHISVRAQYVSVRVQYIDIYYHIHINIHIYGQLNHICLSGHNMYLSGCNI